MGVGHRLDLLPSAGGVENETGQLDQALTLGSADQLAEQVSEFAERIDRLGAQPFDLLEVVNRLQQPCGGERSLRLALG